MKALAIAPQPFFTPRGTPLSVYYRTLVTAELGFEVDLLTYGQGQDVDIPGVRIVRIPSFRRLGAVKVGPSLLKAFLDMFLFVWAVAMMARNRYDIVHAHEEAVFFCRFLKPVFRFKLVYDLHSILSQQLTNFGFTRSRLLIGAFRRLEDGCIAKADAVITISPALAEYALGRVKESEAHFLIENTLLDEVRLRAESGVLNELGADRDAAAADAERDGAGPRADAAAQMARPERPDWMELLSGERPVILYAGTFEKYQGISLLLQSFAALRREEPRAFLLLLGGRPEQVEEYRAEADELGLEEHFHFAGQVPRRMAQEATRQADVLTSPRTTGDNTPLKIYEQIASGVPLVATRIGSHTQVLGDDQCVLVDLDPDSMAEGLHDALRGGPAVEERVRRARRLYEERYSPTVYRDKMRRLLERVSA